MEGILILEREIQPKGVILSIKCVMNSWCKAELAKTPHQDGCDFHSVVWESGGLVAGSLTPKAEGLEL